MTDLISKLFGLEKERLEEGNLGFDWLNMPEPWLLALIIIAVVAIFAFIYRLEQRKASRTGKAALTIVRSVIIIIILLMLFSPIITVDIKKEGQLLVLFLIDDSLSMGKQDHVSLQEHKVALAKACAIPSSQIEEKLKKINRLEIVQAILANKELGIIEKIQKSMKPVILTFSRLPRIISKDTLPELKPSGTETAIGDSIKQALNMFKGQEIACLVLFSDGRNNLGLSPVEVAQHVGKRLKPIFTVSPGIAMPPRDIEITDLEARDWALVNDKVRLKFNLKNIGFEGEETEIALFLYEIHDELEKLSTMPDEIEKRIAKSEKKQSTRVKLPQADQTIQQILTYEPKKEGIYELIIAAEPKEGEITRKNNYLTHKIRVVDHRVRVLYVEYPPRYEYRFLKNALMRDDSVLFHALLTSADIDFPQEHSINIPQSVREKFRKFTQPIQEFPRDLKDLLEYDVIIIGDTDPSLIGDDQTLQNIVKFTEEFGGGVILIAGQHSNPESYLHTPLDHLLPIIPFEPGDEQPIGLDKQVGYSLTLEGQDHPTMQFPSEPDKQRNIERWEDRDDGGDGLPGIYWYKRAKKPKFGAHVLAHIAGIKDSGMQAPLFVWQQYGRGRVFFSATDDTWRWRLLVGDYPYFYPFWKQAIHWAREGKLHEATRYRIRIDKDRYAVGDQVNVYIDAYDQNYERVDDQDIELFIEPPARERYSMRIPVSQDLKGHFIGTFSPQDVGNYRIWIGDPNDQKERAYEQFEVVIPNREEENPVIDENTLKQIAESSKGKYFTVFNIHELAGEVDVSPVWATETKEYEIWDTPFFYLIFALLITAEWIVRKMMRML